MSQQANANPGLQAPTRSTRRNSPDPNGDPIAILGIKGITQDNNTDIAALAAVIESYGDFRTGGKLMTVTAAMAASLQAVAKLLREASRTQAGPATKEDLQNAVRDIKESISSTSGSTRSYADVVGQRNTTTTNHRPMQHQDIKEKQIFISTRNVEKTAAILTLTPSELKERCNTALTKYFAQAVNGNINMPEPIRAISRSNAGNITLTFKNATDVAKARLFADEWVIEIDPAATTPQRLFAVVAHNVSKEAWDGDEISMKDAIQVIEKENTDATGMAFSITKITWLNGTETREKTNRGPLMISFKNKEDANASIRQSLAFNGELKNVSIFIPRAPQCFRCQDWGHRATECTGEAQCGLCAGDHETSNHSCAHTDPCPTGRGCIRDKLKCANCSGEHASWTRSCPAAKAAFEKQTRREEYRTGSYETFTPFTFADIHFKPARQKHHQHNTSNSDEDHNSNNPSFNLIAPTSPIVPDPYE